MLRQGRALAAFSDGFLCFFVYLMTTEGLCFVSGARNMALCNRDHICKV